MCCDGSLSHPPEFSVRAPFERSCRMRVAAKTLISSAPPAGSKQVFKDVDSQRRGAPFRPAQRRARSHFHDVAAPSPTASGSEGARARSRTMWAPHGEAIHLPPLGNIIAGRARARAPFLGSGRRLDCLSFFSLLVKAMASTGRCSCTRPPSSQCTFLATRIRAWGDGTDMTFPTSAQNSAIFCGHAYLR